MGCFLCVDWYWNGLPEERYAVRLLAVSPRFCFKRCLWNENKCDVDCISPCCSEYRSALCRAQCSLYSVLFTIVSTSPLYVEQKKKWRRGRDKLTDRQIEKKEREVFRVTKKEDSTSTTTLDLQFELKVFSLFLLLSVSSCSPPAFGSVLPPHPTVPYQIYM